MFYKAFTALLVVVLLSGAVASSALVTQAQTLTVNTDKTQYAAGETVMVNGTAGNNTDVTIQVFNPRNSLVDIDIVRADDNGSFTKSFKLPSVIPQGGWLEGNYTLRAFSNSVTAQANFSVTASAAPTGQNVTVTLTPSFQEININETAIFMGSISFIGNATTGNQTGTAGNQTSASNQTGVTGNQTGANMTGTGNQTVATNQTGAAANMTMANVTAINYLLNVTGLSNITGAHIHMGAPDENGPIVVSFYPIDTNASSPLGPPINVSGVLSQGVITAANLTGPLNGSSLGSLVSLIQNGSAYVNVHTSRYPGGEIRGQIMPVGGNQTKPSNVTTPTNATQNLVVIDITMPNGTTMTYHINTSGIANITGTTSITINITSPEGRVQTITINLTGVTNATQATNMTQTGNMTGPSNMNLTGATDANMTGTTNMTGVTSYIANMTGGAEVPPNNSTARGIAVFNVTTLPSSTNMTGVTNQTGAGNATGVAGNNTIVGLLAANQSFSTLVTAVNAAGLAGTLNGTGPYTIFAPTNDAFNNLLQTKGMTAQDLLNNTDLLRAILMYHVVAGNYSAANVTNTKSLQTLQGSNLSVNVSGNTVKVDSAIVLRADMIATNGIIHVVNAVMIPANVTLGNQTGVPANATAGNQTGVTGNQTGQPGNATGTTNQTANIVTAFVTLPNGTTSSFNITMTTPTTFNVTYKPTVTGNHTIFAIWRGNATYGNVISNNVTLRVYNESELPVTINAIGNTTIYSNVTVNGTVQAAAGATVTAHIVRPDGTQMTQNITTTANATGGTGNQTGVTNQTSAGNATGVAGNLSYYTFTFRPDMTGMWSVYTESNGIKSPTRTFLVTVNMTPQTYNVTRDGRSFNIMAISNSTLAFSSATNTSVVMTPQGLNGTVGFANITFPNDFLRGPFNATMGGLSLPVQGTNSTAYMVYNHTGQPITITGTQASQGSIQPPAGGPSLIPGISDMLLLGIAIVVIIIIIAAAIGLMRRR